jgi:hypothetical protein
VRTDIKVVNVGVPVFAHPRVGALHARTNIRD